MADREDDESVAGLTQNTFLKAPLEPCFDLFSGLLEGDSNLGECSNNTSNNTTTYSDHVLTAEKELEVDTLNSKDKVKLCKNEKSETTRSGFHNCTFFVQHDFLA